MKKYTRITLTALLICLFLLAFVSCTSDVDNSLTPMTSSLSSPGMGRIINPDSEVRGVWIASVYNIDYPSSSDLSAASLREEIDSIISVCKENNLNTVYFQVRPTCDALYASDIFPVSRWLSTGGNMTFDPLDYFLTEAKKNNIFLYAWVNPLRITVDSSDISALPADSPAREHPDWVVDYCGKLYFDPGIPEVRDLVTEGVREIVKKYDVDGVVFDDYFYPYPAQDSSGRTAEFNDKATYKKYGSEFDTVADWRRDNINSMVLSCYNAVHSEDSECVFGVSPFGVWQNDNGKNGGSSTKNLEGYNDLYCDALAWANSGYVDFLSPQIYWRFDSQTSPYDTVVRWWNAKLDGTGVKLIVSHSCYQYDETWVLPEMEMNEQISYSRSEKTYYGSMMYGYDEIRRNVHSLSDELTELFSDEIVYTDIISNGLGITVTSPGNGSTTSSDTSYLIGSCDPYYPLTVNGNPVSITKSGYFNLFEKLEKGENTFIFEQNGTEYRYVITYDPSNSSMEGEKDSGKYLDSLKIDSFYPSSDVATSDEKLLVSCVAPYGFTVTAELNGSTYFLTSDEQPKREKEGYPALTYKAAIDLPRADDGKIIDCGNLTFRMQGTYGRDEAAGPRVRILGKDAPLEVEAIKDYTSLKISKYSSYYEDYTVQSIGMTDYADSLSDGFYHLRMGGFIPADCVNETDTPLPREGSVLSDLTVKNNTNTTDIIISCHDSLPYNGTVENGQFVLTLYNTSGEFTSETNIGSNPLIKDVSAEFYKGKTRFYFSLYDTDNFYGFDLRYEDDSIIVSLKNPRLLDFTSPKPLNGVRIVLDAGHGGDEPGARGCSEGVDEKDINLMLVLESAEKLRDLGADVILTRSDDSTVSLYERMDFLEETEPDLSVSLHQNSADFTSDIRSIRGTLGLYCMDSGVLLAKTLSSSLASALGRWCQPTRSQMLALCRNPKFPSALIEVGYMTSVEEYEEILSERGIALAADAVADGIIEYFRHQSQFISSFSD